MRIDIQTEGVDVVWARVFDDAGKIVIDVAHTVHLSHAVVLSFFGIRKGWKKKVLIASVAGKYCQDDGDRAIMDALAPRERRHPEAAWRFSIARVSPFVSDWSKTYRSLEFAEALTCDTSLHVYSVVPIDVSFPRGEEHEATARVIRETPSANQLAEYVQARIDDRAVTIGDLARRDGGSLVAEMAILSGHVFQD